MENTNEMTIQEIHEEYKLKKQILNEAHNLRKEIFNTFYQKDKKFKSEKELDEVESGYKKASEPCREKIDKLIEECSSLSSKWYERATLLLSKLENK